MNTLKFKTVFATIACALVFTAYSSDASGQTVGFPATGGPGTEMTQIINRMGLGSNCSRCKALAAEMDAGGADWVLQNRDYVVQRTISNAQALGHRMGPVQRMGVRAIVTRSARRAR